MIKKTLILCVLLIFLVSTASAATLSVGPKAKYHTIQSAVNAAKNGDTISVAAGTYKENVVVGNKYLKIIGQKGKYPTVYGFNNKSPEGSFDINGFKITKYGVSYVFNTPAMLVRNNYFMNCQLVIHGVISSGSVIMNNQFIGPKAGLTTYDTGNLIITGNRFTKCKIGIDAGDTGIEKASGNIFTQCDFAVKIIDWIYGTGLSGFSGNKYVNNKNKFDVKVY